MSAGTVISGAVVEMIAFAVKQVWELATERLSPLRRGRGVLWAL